MLAEEMHQGNPVNDLVKILLGQLKMLLERDMRDANRREKILKSRVSQKKLTEYANRHGARRIPFSAKLTKEQMKELSRQCKKNNIAFAAMRNKTMNADSSYDYSIIILEKDAAMFRKIQEQMLKDKLDIDKMQEEIVNGDPSSANKQMNEWIFDRSAGNKEAHPPLTFNQVMDNLSKRSEGGKEAVFVCERMNPRNHMEVTSSIGRRDDREYLNTNYRLFSDGIEQKCSEFAHGKFTHMSWMDGSNESDAGKKHWQNMKKELQEKGHFTDDLVMFTSEKEYTDYLTRMNEMEAQKAADKWFFEMDKNFRERKEALTEELGKCNSSDRTDNGLKEIIQRQIESNKKQADMVNKINILEETEGHDNKKSEDIRKELSTEREYFMEQQAQKELLQSVRFIEQVKNEKIRDIEADTNSRNKEGSMMEENNGRQESMPRQRWEEAVGKRKEASESVNEGMEQSKDQVHAKADVRGL